MLAATAALMLLAATCSSEPSTETQAEPPTTQPPPTQATDAQGIPATVPAVPETRDVTVPAGIPPLPPVDIDTAIPQPSAEDAAFEFLFGSLLQHGYTLASGCEGLNLETRPNVICLGRPQVDPNDSGFVSYTVSQPPPGVPWYSVFVQEVPDVGWRVFAATEILR